MKSPCTEHRSASTAGVLLKALMAFVLAIGLTPFFPENALAGDGDGAVAVASVGEKNCTSLYEAFREAYQQNMPVKILTDFITDESLWVFFDVTLDLNGKTITSTADQQVFFIEDGAKLTILDNGSEEPGAIVSDHGNILVFVMHGELDLQKGTLRANGSNDSNGRLYGKTVIHVLGSSDPNVENYSVVKIGEDAVVSCATQTTEGEPINAGYAVSVSVNSSTTPNCAYGVSVDFNGKSENAILYVNGSIVESDGNIPVITLGETAYIDQGIYAAGYARWNIDGASVVGSTGMEIRAGELNMTSGLLRGTSTSTSIVPNGSGSTTEGAGLAIAQHTSELPIKVNVTGGEIVGCTSLCESNPQQNENKVPVEVQLANVQLNGDVAASGFGSITISNATIDGRVVATGSTGHVALFGSSISESIKGPSVVVYGCTNGAGVAISNQGIDSNEAVFNGQAMSLADALEKADTAGGGTVRLVANANIDSFVPVNTILEIMPGKTLTVADDKIASLASGLGVIRVDAGAKIVVAGKAMIGDESSNISLSSGQIDLSVEQSGASERIKFDFTDAVASVPAEKRWTTVMEVGPSPIPMMVNLDASSVLTIDSTGVEGTNQTDGLRVANDSAISNSGTIIVNGVMTVSSRGQISGNGSIVVGPNGLLEVNTVGANIGQLGNDVANNGVVLWNGTTADGLAGEVAMGSGSRVYSQANVSSKLTGTYREMGDKAFDGTNYAYAWEQYVPSAGGSGVVAESYDVAIGEFADGKVTSDAAKAEEGDEVTLTVVPDAGFELETIAVVGPDGEEVDLTANADGTYSFEMPGFDVEVEASFACDGGELCPSHGFADVDQDEWYHDAIDWAVANGVLNGFDGTGLMMPDGEVTRAQMAQVLWNVEGRPAVAEDPGFSDVSDADWFYGAVAWAASEGVFEGYDGTDSFGPDDVLTREQAAAVLMRWTEANGGDVDARADLSGYPDASSVDGWAVEYVSWAVASGVISGVEQEDGTLLLDPAGTATRAQTAMLMMRLVEA